MARSYILLFLLIGFRIAAGSTAEDSLVVFSDLKFHSELEKQSFTEFSRNGTEALNLFLSIDKELDEEDAAVYARKFEEIIESLENKNIASKKINKKIKVAYTAIHSQYLKRYINNSFMASIFESGEYNCVSASMLYGLVFDRVDIPYKVMISQNHAFLVANPGSNSVVVETTNPGFEQQIFTGEFKQQYVSQLRESKQISEQEYRSKSAEEIFEAKLKEVRDADFRNLPGAQYNNLALLEFQDNNVGYGYELCQKAYYLFPDPQIRILLHTALAFQIDQCKFNKIEDIDYLVQYSRYENTDPEIIVGIFNNLINQHMQYTDRVGFCDSLYRRLDYKISDEYLKRELAFNFNYQMAVQNRFNDLAELYAAKAISIKPNHRDANQLFEYLIGRKVENISQPEALLDTIARLESRYPDEMVREIIYNYRMVGYLRVARENFRKNRLRTGESYLLKFEEECPLPVENNFLQAQIEATYSTAAAYYANNNYLTKSRNILRRGLKFVPDSQILNSIKL